MLKVRDTVPVRVATVCGLAWLLAVAPLSGQQEFQFVLSVLDASGAPVDTLTPADVVMAEEGIANTIVDVQPFRRPVKLTIAVDNGPASRDALSHYRSGLTGLIQALPPDMEVSLLTIAPQPRYVVKSTTDHDELLAGINRFAPDTYAPRFTDTIVEFSKRLQDELEDNGNVVDSVPVLIIVSTTAVEATSYQVPEIDQAFQFLRGRRARLYIAMVTVRQFGGSPDQINEGRQTQIGIPAVEFIGGTYEPLAISNRLATLLPEWGEEIAELHRKYDNQWLITVRRREGLTGGIRQPAVGLVPEGLTGELSRDGLPAPPVYNP